MTHNSTPSAIFTGGKFLTFVVDEKIYGLEILRIREIIRMLEITPVPEMPAYIKGVINLRGKIVPVVDLRLKFSLPPIEINERSCTVVVTVNTHSGNSCLMGLLVDSVEEVLTLAGGDLEATPDFGLPLATEYIKGMAKLDSKVMTLLDIDRVVAAGTIQAASHSPLPAPQP
ncbi:MAG: chemotaxis protein CheW [Verrucomicrobiae bacterium]|nr:chemotaxis protein CheW [Verrucomicrobiae bacterium]